MEIRVEGICPKCGTKVVITDGINFRCASPECDFDSQTISERLEVTPDGN